MKANGELESIDVGTSSDCVRRPRFFAALRMTVLWGVLVSVAAAAESVVGFEGAEVAKRVEVWEEKGVTFKLAHAPKQTKAVGRLVFFEHHGTERKGILCAMAMEPIPVEVTFPREVKRATLAMWASTGCPVVVEAIDAEGNVVDREELKEAPRRKAPEEAVPIFEVTVEGERIAKVRFSGPRGGEFLAADEVRWAE